MLVIDGIGELSAHPGIPDRWWISRPVPLPFFSGLELKFTISFPPGENGFPVDVGAAVKRFLALTAADRLAATEPVFENYRDFLDLTDIDPLPVTVPEDIWNFVSPTKVLVSREDDDVYIQVLCECDWEVEHGLQLVYRRGDMLTRVSEQDGHPTE